MNAAALYSGAMSDAIARNVFRMRQSFGETQTVFAARFGVQQGTVSRWEKGAVPEPEQLAKLAQLAGQTIQDFIGLGGIPGAQLPGDLIEVRGSVAAGVWKGTEEWPEEDRYFVTGGGRSAVKPPHRFGLRVEGQSMNLVYPEGSVLDCVSILSLSEEPQPGRRVVVRRTRKDGSIETTVKELAVGADGNRWLLARSTEPEFQAPIPAADGDPDIVETRIIAVVVGSYRPEE